MRGYNRKMLMKKSWRAPRAFPFRKEERRARVQNKWKACNPRIATIMEQNSSIVDDPYAVTSSHNSILIKYSKWEASLNFFLLHIGVRTKKKHNTNHKN